MTRSPVFKPTFFVSILLGLIGALFKILHIPGAQMLLGISALLSLVSIISALYEIYSSDRVTVNERIMWTVGFVLFNGLTLLLYFFFGRPRILREYKILDL